MTRYSSISSRKLSSALQVLTHDKCMVAISDYNDFHKNIKKHILANVLGASAQVDNSNFLVITLNSFFFDILILPK